MNEPNTTIEIESIVDKLSGICWNSVANERSVDRQEIHSLLKSLSANGWKRHNTDEAPLAVQIERRATELGGEEVANHPKRLTALAQEIGDAFDAITGFSTSVQKQMNETNE